MPRAGWAAPSSAIRSMAAAKGRCSCTAGGWSCRAAPSRRSTSPRPCPTASACGWTSSMPEGFEIPEDALSERFLAATGPGGQNVNKVATACQLRVDVFRLGLAPHAYDRLKQLAGSRMTTGGELIITARRYRTQEGNRAD